ncbi:MAG: CPBP family intramembrane metalloprotease [Defluviitaleaceae bacterium]|nr:CPBP family intramembrane metalloprotease [Defluviitaleaceae bacterium]
MTVEKRSIKDGNIFMLLLLVWFMFFGDIMGLVFMGLAALGLPISAVPAPGVVVLMQVGFFLLPLGIWLALRKDKLRDVLPSMPLGGTNFAYIVAISILLQPLLMGIVLLTNFIFPNNVAEFIGGMMHYPWWLMIVAIAVMPAICEEFVFRGYIQTKHRHLPFWKMLTANGLFFAIIHMNPHQFFYAFVMGVIFAVMVHFTRSIWAGVLSHFVLNASQVSLMYFFASLEGQITPAETEAVASQAETIVAYGFLVFVLLACTGAAFTLTKAFIQHNKERIPKEELPEDTPKVRFFDGYVMAVILLFLLFTLLLPMATRGSSRQEEHHDTIAITSIKMPA